MIPVRLLVQRARVSFRASFSKHFSLYLNSVLGLLFLLGIGYVLFFQPPVSFPQGGVYVEIPAGYTVRASADLLARKHIIASPNLFVFLAHLWGGAQGVQAGLYRFNHPAGLVEVAHRLLTGDLGVDPVRITFPEGMTVREMAPLIAARFPSISAAAFEKAAAADEGYLFPDTYTFLPDVTIHTLTQTMRNNFNAHIASITPEIEHSGHTLKQIVIMASLVEKEGRTLQEKRMIAGILWHRLRIGMPLQVDAVFGFIFHRPTYSPTLADLTVRSPYNTYIHKGLPPGPIDNPGFDSLLAVVTPTKTPYLYYLTGKDGKMHYAKTLAGHNRNHTLYLR